MSIKKAQPQQEESGEKAPLWIISFADMISLLMAFFVMLQTMAIPRSGKLTMTKPGIFESTKNGFQSSIRHFGLPELFSGKSSSNLPHYAMDGGKASAKFNLALDGKEEKCRRIFTRLRQTAQTHTSRLEGKTPVYFSTPITFSQTNAQLSAEAENYLSGLVNSIQQTIKSEKDKVCVMGIAPDIGGTEEQWLVSEQRAAAVADYLRKTIPSLSADNFHWWGAGKGGQWVNQNNTSSAQSHIFITILSER